MCSCMCALCGGVSPSERARKCVHMCPVCVPFSIKAAIAQQAWFSTLPKPTVKPAPHKHESSALSLRLKRLQSLWWHLDTATSATSHIHIHLKYRCLKWPTHLRPSTSVHFCLSCFLFFFTLPPLPVPCAWERKRGTLLVISGLDNGARPRKVANNLA